MSRIEWTDETWNPTIGCSRVSPGCDHCYAATQAHRALTPAHRGLTIHTEGRGVDWNGQVRCLPERLDIPRRRRTSTRWFVDSMSDLFHPAVPDEFIADVFAVMARADWHVFQLLTKRPRRMARLLRSRAFLELLTARLGGLVWPLPNVWAGTSIEAHRWADRRLWHLLATPAAIRWVSAEPLLGPVDLARAVCEADQDNRDAGIGRGLSRRFAHAAGCCSGALGRHLDWVVVGGESGPGARPMHPRWVRDIRDQCTAAGVAFFFKQWGAWTLVDDPKWGTGRHTDRAVGYMAPPAVVGNGGVARMRRVGKGAAGRHLDGRTWDELPPDREAR